MIYGIKVNKKIINGNDAIVKLNATARDLSNISSSDNDANEMLKELSTNGLKNKFKTVFNLDCFLTQNSIQITV